MPSVRFQPANVVAEVPAGTLIKSPRTQIA